MKFAENLSKIMPGSQKTPEGKVMFYFFIFFLVFLLVSIIVGFVVFGTTMKGKPVVSVPSIKGMELLDAMQELQNYGLVAEVHEKKPKDNIARGIVFAQHPREGANVKMGGKVVLSVSRGMGEILLQDFNGRFIDDVEESIRRINEQTGNPNFITLKLNKVYNKAQVNEVLSQFPEPGTKIKEPIELTLQVSLGRWVPTVVVPDVMGLSYKEAIQILSEKNIPFNFRHQKARRNQKEGNVVSQTPEKSSKIKVGSFVDISIASLKTERGKVFGIYEMQLPSYQIPLTLTVYVKAPKGEETVYFTMKHPGGNLSFPYYEDEETLFTIKVEDEQIGTFAVK